MDPNLDPDPKKATDHRPLEKVNPIPKFTLSVKNSCFKDLGALISNMTIAFSNSNPKIPDIFGPKFKYFYFCKKLCICTNSWVLISNVEIVFKAAAQNAQIRHF